MQDIIDGFLKFQRESCRPPGIVQATRTGQAPRALFIACSGSRWSAIELMWVVLHPKVFEH